MRKTVQMSLIAITFGLLAFACTTAAMAATTAPAPDDPAGILRALYDAATTKQWTVLAGVAMIGVTYAVRRWVLGRWQWAQTRIGGFVLAFGLSLAATFGVALAAGGELSAALALDALGTAMAAAGGWTWLQQVTERKPVLAKHTDTGGN